MPDAMITPICTGNYCCMNRILVCLLPFFAGCATNLSSLQTAKTLNPGQVRITGGFGVHIPAGQLMNSAAEGIKLGAKTAMANVDNRPYVLTADDKESIGTAAIALAMFPPSSLWEINGRVGIIRNLDVGFRYSINSLRGDVKLRVHHSGDAEGWDEKRGRSYDVAIAVGLSKYMLGNQIEGAFGGVRLDDFNRWDLEVPVYFNADWNSHIGLYFVPKFLYSRTTMRQTFLAQPCECAEGTQPEVVTQAKVDMMFYGATLGIRFGGWRVSGLLEVTVGNTEASPVLFGKKRTLGGATIQPNIGLAVTF